MMGVLPIFFSKGLTYQAALLTLLLSNKRTSQSEREGEGVRFLFLVRFFD